MFPPPGRSAWHREGNVAFQTAKYLAKIDCSVFKPAQNKTSSPIAGLQNHSTLPVWNRSDLNWNACVVVLYVIWSRSDYLLDCIRPQRVMTLWGFSLFATGMEASISVNKLCCKSSFALCCHNCFYHILHGLSWDVISQLPESLKVLYSEIKRKNDSQWL